MTSIPRSGSVSTADSTQPIEPTESTLPPISFQSADSSHPTPALLQPPSESQPLSKKALKRQLKSARFAASKAERRAREKARKREKKKEAQAERTEKQRVGKDQSQTGGEVRDHDDSAHEDEGNTRPAKRRKVDSGQKQKQNQQTTISKKSFDARIVIDLAFDELMSEKEVNSLVSQLAYTYSAHRKARTPVSALLCTHLDGKTLARFEALGGQFRRWRGVEFWEKGYEELWEGRQDRNPEDQLEDRRDHHHAEREVENETLGAQDGSHQKHKRSPPQRSKKECIVYLTGDANEELTELKEGETYIIGGICDHNRYKNLCLNKAQDQSVRAARLPIGTYLKGLPTRKILTVNQVFDILLQWIETRDWEKALYAVMPKRKFQQGGVGKSGAEGQHDGSRKIDLSMIVVGESGEQEEVKVVNDTDEEGSGGTKQTEGDDTILVDDVVSDIANNPI